MAMEAMYASKLTCIPRIVLTQADTCTACNVAIGQAETLNLYLLISKYDVQAAAQCADGTDCCMLADRGCRTQLSVAAQISAAKIITWSAQHRISKPEMLEV